MAEKGKIIFLNGVSSSGKTTLAKALQNRLEDPFYVINIDTFCGTGIMFPEKFATDDAAGFAMFRRTLFGMHQTIKLYSDLRFNTIVDHVLTYNETSEECSGKIAAALRSDVKPTAFEHLWSQRQKASE